MVFGILDGLLIDLMTNGVALASEGAQTDTRIVKKQVLGQLIMVNVVSHVETPSYCSLVKDLGGRGALRGGQGVTLDGWPLSHLGSLKRQLVAGTSCSNLGRVHYRELPSLVIPSCAKRLIDIEDLRYCCSS